MERVSRGRSLLLLIAVPLLTWQMWHLARPFLAAPAARAEDTITLVLALAALLAWLWFAVALTLVSGEALVTARVRRGHGTTHRAARAVVSLLCGIGTIAIVAPAHAETPVSSPGVVSSINLDGLPVPDRLAGERLAPVPPTRVTTEPPRISTPAPAPDPTPLAQTVTVQPGDSLWRLALQHDITWTELYELNRAVVGEDPRLIYPGQQLRLPSAGAQS